MISLTCLCVDIWRLKDNIKPPFILSFSERETYLFSWAGRPPSSIILSTGTTSVCMPQFLALYMDVGGSNSGSHNAYQAH